MAKEPLSPRIRQILLLGTMITLWLLAMAAADGVMHWSQKTSQEFTPISIKTARLQNGELRLIKYYKIPLAGISQSGQAELIEQLFNQVVDESSDFLNAGGPDNTISNSNSLYYFKKAVWPDDQGFLLMGFLIDRNNLEAISYFGTGKDSIQDEVYFQSMVSMNLGN